MSGKSRSEQVVLIPRRGKTTAKQAYQVACERLIKQGFTPVRLVSYSIDLDKRTGRETFLLRVEVEPGSASD